jgi:hypothetical protein
MQLMQMIHLSTLNAIGLAFFGGMFAYVLVERPDVRENVKVYIAGGLCVAGMYAFAVMLLSL